MSYILDALKKAEAEQDPNARAALAISEQHSQRHRMLLYVLIVALLVNAVVLVYLFVPGPSQQPPVSGQAGAAPAAQPAAPAPAARPEAAEPVAAATAAAADPTPAPRVAPAQPEAEPAAPIDTGPRSVALANLPPASLSRFPELSFSTHLYASDAELRAVVVNGQRLREGESFGTLTLHRITEDGVVFRFENYLVSVSVLDDWD